MDVKTELMKLVDEDGMLQAERVVDAARSEQHPLHEYFTWDDAEAAESWRLEQARKLIRSVTITLADGTPSQVRAWVSLPGDRVHGTGYRAMSDVITSEFLCQQLRAEIDSQVKAWQRRGAELGLLISARVKRRA